MGILVFDTETTGLPNEKFDLLSPSQPHICQLAAVLCHEDGTVRGGMNFIIQPDGWVIPDKLAQLHGITTETAQRFGISIKGALSIFARMVGMADMIVAHNIGFDLDMLAIECQRTQIAIELPVRFCTMRESTEHVKAPPTERMLAKGMKGYKNPNLKETYRHFFGSDFDGAHDAAADVRACKDVYFHLQTLKAAA